MATVRAGTRTAAIVTAAEDDTLTKKARASGPFSRLGQLRLLYAAEMKVIRPAVPRLR